MGISGTTDIPSNATSDRRLLSFPASCGPKYFVISASIHHKAPRSTYSCQMCRNNIWTVSLKNI